MSEDVVNNPKHYNKQGIEVIEVIEAYTPDSPHLANVLKYVCRCEYKGKKLQDLKKASWYLDRAIVLLEAEEDCAEWEVDPANEDWTGIDRGVSDWTLDDIEPRTSGGYTERDVEVFFQGYDCRQQEEAEERGLTRDEVAEQFEADDWMGLTQAVKDLSVPEEDLLGGKWRVIPEEELREEAERLNALAVMPSPDRIAGDNEAAKRIKDEYYNFDRFEIQGYCASCDAEIGATQPYLKSFYFDADLKFCKQQCIDSLKAWQKDWKAE